MTTLSQLQENLKVAKLDIKLLEASNLIVDSYLSRNVDFSFNTYGIQVEIFKSKIFSCGQLNLNVGSFAHFLEMGKDVLTEETKLKVRKLKAAFKLVESNSNRSYEFLAEACQKIK